MYFKYKCRCESCKEAAAKIRRENKLRKMPTPQISEGNEWMKQGKCRGMDTSLFFNNDGDTSGEVRQKIVAARKVCYACPVEKECLNYALVSFERGFWGGTTENERNRIRTKQAAERIAEKNKVGGQKASVKKSKAQQQNELMRRNRQSLIDNASGIKKALLELTVLVADVADSHEEERLDNNVKS